MWCRGREVMEFVLPRSKGRGWGIWLTWRSDCGVRTKLYRASLFNFLKIKKQSLYFQRTAFGGCFKSYSKTTTHDKSRKVSETSTHRRSGKDSKNNFSKSPPKILWCSWLPKKLQDLLFCNSTKNKIFSEDFLKTTF